MRRGLCVFFSIVLVLACCFITGCTSAPSDSAQPEKVNAGVSFATDPDENRNYTFDEVISAIYVSKIGPDADSPSISDQVHIQSITGVDLDDTGNASSWTFIVNYQNNTKFVTYDKYGESVASWPSGFSGEEVFPDQVVSPETLIKNNRDTIFKTSQSISTEKRKLVLAGNTYTLTIMSGNNPRVLIFDAKTGALTSSNE